MKMRNLFTSLCLATLCFSVSAQTYLGVHSSNYSGVMGTDFNPASFVDGRFVFDLNLASFNFNLYTNAASFNTAGMPKWWLKSFKSDKNSLGETSIVDGGSNPYNDWMVLPDSTSDIERHIEKNYSVSSIKKIGVYNSLQVDVLNFMFHIKPTIAVGFAAKVRSVTNVDDIDPKLGVLLEMDFLSDSTDAVNYATSLWGNKFDEGLLNMNHMIWAEYGVIYSQVIKDDGEHFMKVGGKAKWLAGYTAAYIHTDDFSYSVENDSTFSDVSGSFSYGHSRGTLEGEQMTGTPKSASDWGLGLDLGFIYEWRPDWKEYKYDMDGETNIWRRDKEKYKMRAGVSILDIGGMKFQKGALNRDFKINNGSGWDFRAAFDDDSDLEEIDHSIDSLITNDPTVSLNGDDDGTFFMSTPTAIGLQFDYNIYKWFYVNASGTISVQNRKNPHRVRVANQVSVTPSFDYAWAGVGLPISYNKYSGLKAGLGMRLGPLTVGVTDFKALLAKGKVNGAEFYAGLRVPILYTHPSDVDGDLVSDDKDECLVVPGVWAFRGCPDTDRDGIKDIEDHCPNEAGLPEFDGCPDMDGDSIPDKDDSCPELFGSKEMGGCPDTDKDGIIDPKDECPEIAGIEKFKGCPDTDGDGIKDSEDACPEVAGPLVNNGCPDTDGDGLFDFIDGCPTEFGPKENNGCPWPDTDKDGLLDKDDHCPNIAGPKTNNGCPFTDTDKDGVLDKDDKCPATPGPVENEGCPVIEEEVQEILNTAFENLEFETGSDVIKEESLPSLSELAEVLVKKEAWKLQIAGHTDNVGSAQGNLILSKKRSEAVKTFMISKGIDASRLSALYFGETAPVADNKTKEGRQKNRRVEMTIIFE